MKGYKQSHSLHQKHIPRLFPQSVQGSQSSTEYYSLEQIEIECETTYIGSSVCQPENSHNNDYTDYINRLQHLFSKSKGHIIFQN